MLVIAASNQGTQSGHDFAVGLSLAFYIENNRGVLKPTSDLDEASLEHDQEGGRYHEPGSTKANRKWMNRAWSLGSRQNKTYEQELKRTPRYWGDLRGAAAFVADGTRYALDLYPMISGTILFGTTNLVNTGIRGLRWGGDRLGIHAKFKVHLSNKGFNMKGSYFKFQKPKCLICKKK
ncbi:MAG: hypothetical protein H7A23_11090 [Leptospiraceae bacterium]|nr:hypothetical protein [Leptospiraceae bacterium]MCP5495089.1 hypothetical protein [Leptospiraceae bacterium]